MSFIRRLIDSRITKLNGDNEYLTNQIQFLAQRLEDVKLVLKNNVLEIATLKDALSAPIPPPWGDVRGTQPKPEVAETRRGLTDSDEGMDGFGN